MDYENSSWAELQRIWPKVLDLRSVSPPDDLAGVDKVLFLACAGDPTLLRELPFRRKKKIESLLETNSRFLMPDLNFYNDILTQIKQYGNSKDYKIMCDFAENCDDDEIPLAWRRPEFAPLDGEQEEL